MENRKEHGADRRMALGSLFDGIGGFPYAASFYGIHTLWASEVVPECISVTKRHFPDMVHAGDITKLHCRIPHYPVLSARGNCAGRCEPPGIRACPEIYKGKAPVCGVNAYGQRAYEKVFAMDEDAAIDQVTDALDKKGVPYGLCMAEEI